jgi:6-phosphofructokinase 1
MNFKRIGILTSGGDCPGLNAVIRAVVKTATRKGWEVYGITHGTDGFIEIAEGKKNPEYFKIDQHSFDIPGQRGLDILLFLSGSVLGCRGKKEPLPDEKEKILTGYQKLNLDALVAIGGDGSLDIIYQYAQEGNWNLIGIPKTIDNDVPLTEKVIGFNTAVDIVATALYNLTFTAASHDRVMIVEVMGRDAGHLALQAGIAGGADVILIPELTRQLDDTVIEKVCYKIAQIHQDKRNFALIAIAEGIRDRDGKEQKEIGIGNYLKNQIEDYSNQHCDPTQPGFCGLAEKVEIRVTALGHIQRSSPPSSLDRLLASAFGVKAVDLIEQGEFNQMVVLQKGKVQSIPLEKLIPLIHDCCVLKKCSSPVKADDFIVKTATDLDICLGI